MNRRVHLPRPGAIARAARPAPVAGPTTVFLDAMRSTDVLQLQSAAGNRAARGAVQRKAEVGQRKMEVGAAHDPHEMEADAVAREIVNGTSTPAAPQRQSQEEDELQMKRIDREAMPEEEELQLKRVQREAEEEELQMKRIEREAAPEEDELQMKRVQRYEGVEDVEDEAEADLKRVQRDAAPEVGMDGGAASADTSAAVEGARGGGQALGEGVRSEMEGHFGADFSGVRVHQDSQAADLNDRLSARAFTTGSDIFIGREGLNTGSRGGKELLAHELTHVVQQGAAGRKPRR